jgi:hypothetical protein
MTCKGSAVANGPSQVPCFNGKLNFPRPRSSSPTFKLLRSFCPIDHRSQLTSTACGSMSAPRRDIPNVDIDELMSSSAGGIATIRGNLNNRRALTQEAKVCCSQCSKQESTSPLQSCSRCRYVALTYSFDRF